MNTEIQISNKRNENGVKASCDQYRTFGGVHFVCMSFGQSNATDVAKSYKAQGARVRRIGSDVYVAAADVGMIQ